MDAPSISSGSGTPEDPWRLKTPPLSSDYTMHRAVRDGQDIIVCTVGKTMLFYDARCIEAVSYTHLVKAVIAESYERIHRSNLIGMGVLPLQYPDGQTADSLGLDGTETYDITGVTELNEGRTPKTVHVKAAKADGTVVEFDARLRIDTPGERDYYRNDGILQYVLRGLVAS